MSLEKSICKSRHFKIHKHIKNAILEKIEFSGSIMSEQAANEKGRYLPMVAPIIRHETGKSDLLLNAIAECYAQMYFYG